MTEVVQNQSKKFILVIKTRYGVPLFKSSPFETESLAIRILQSLKQQAVIERKTNHNGNFVFQLKTYSGVLMGKSNTYYSEAGMENGIKNVLKALKD